MRPDEKSAPIAHALAHATFIISGEFVSAQFWSAYFGVQPDREITKGQPFKLPSGKLSPRPGTLGLWAVESKSAVHSDSLGPHLKYLVGRLGLPRADLRELAAAQGAKVALWCYWMNESGDRVPDVPDDIRAMMEAMGGTVEIDEYR
ncbi:DUF4279 domain-containing protein [Paraburkholderia unamae]|uniref:Uncharacterized protein DUF4279 n=1 Tax=Paraburkholderia unamae TaxID=219649 RepID=A0ABX5KQK0_9BURK|nr:DUF4279 domain-containing protein [Paraburkholderia unamae]PVX83963.1 uncharacterized protein DUF4279 [Paraburkholderia unamae]CAG9264966.1 conserved hypothetical protein [Paraburkholderia unamae]